MNTDISLDTLTEKCNCHIKKIFFTTVFKEEVEGAIFPLESIMLISGFNCVISCCYIGFQCKYTKCSLPKQKKKDQNRQSYYLVC